MDRTCENALITGISGSGGSYLAEHIVDNHPDVAVHGLSRWHSTGTNKNLDRVSGNITLHECDLNDYGSVLTAIDEIRPDYVFHLAAYANVRTSFDTPLSVLENNIMGTANLLDALRRTKQNPRFQMCSSSEVYGQVDPKDVPITEECPIRPASVYAITKVTQDLLGRSYANSYGMDVITTRMFAYINPRRGDLFATAFASQVAKIEAGLQDELLHGNLDSTRTLIDVRDAMSSYWTATEKGKAGEVYNIGGEKVIKVGEFLDVLKDLSKVDIPSRVNPDLLRPQDVTLQIPDTSKFKNETGWAPQYTFEESVGHLLEHCRDEVSKQVPK